MSSAIKNLVRQVLPPFMAAGLRQLRTSDAKPILEYAPNGWDTLISGGEHGWNRDTVVRAEVAKWHAFRKNLEGAGPLGFSHEHTDLSVTRDVYFHNIHLTYAYVLSLAAHGRTDLSVLDWGGGLGHYYLLGKAVLPDLHLHFTCRDVPLMCEEGQRLCPDVAFYADDSCLYRGYDLVMVNGSLGYFKQWKEVLARLCDSAEKYLFLTRLLTVQKSPTFLVLQRTDVYGYNSDMLIQVFNEEELLSIVRDRGFTLTREFVVGEGPAVAGAPEQCRDRGWLFERPRPAAAV